MKRRDWTNSSDFVTIFIIRPIVRLPVYSSISRFFGASHSQTIDREQLNNNFSVNQIFEECHPVITTK